MDTGTVAYIHNVEPTQENIPQGFQGVLVDDYGELFRNKVLGDLENARKQSVSLGGAPTAVVDPVPMPSNPAPLPVPSAWGRLKWKATDTLHLLQGSPFGPLGPPQGEAGPFSGRPGICLQPA